MIYMQENKMFRPQESCQKDSCAFRYIDNKFLKIANILLKVGKKKKRPMHLN